VNAATSTGGDRIQLSSPAGTIRYDDTVDHFEHALLRLMNLDRAEFDRWLSLAEGHQGDVLERLGAGWAELRPIASPAPIPTSDRVEDGPGGKSGRLWHPVIAEAPGFGVALSDEPVLGWLVRWDGERFRRVDDPPAYEEDYFEGDKLEAGGYGAYTEQAGWRLEKAARQVREMGEATGLDAGRVLDVGCGYGFFRVALRDAGYEHEGLEVSEFARRVAASSYGFETHPGVLDEHWRAWPERFDAVTGFDLIEHVDDAEAFLGQVAHILRPRGVVGLKTPNVTCPEADVFGPHYHSLKREHLLFFSPRSLDAAAAAAGLEPVHVTTISHLLSGFVGPDALRAWEEDGRGADIVAWYRKPS
jgi:2-polyprenyl-3-methyl-5-hydroxy-6-metoxy-1,4-benzoquinol methylase